MIIAIDGPSGAGKSTLASLLAQRYNLRHMDTGAMYRAVGLAARQAGLDITNEASLAELVARLDLL